MASHDGSGLHNFRCSFSKPVGASTSRQTGEEFHIQRQMIDCLARRWRASGTLAELAESSRSMRSLAYYLLSFETLK